MTTTVKVSDALRDRLKSQASRDGLTLGEHLSRLADEFERAERFRALDAAIRSMSVDTRAGYTAEVDDWERAELDDARG